MMNCYFYAPPGVDATMGSIYERIRRTVDRPDLQLVTNSSRSAGEIDFDPDRSSNQPELEQMDAFIIEGTKSDAEIGFLLAHAIALKKPTLYLYQRGTVAKVLSHLSLKELPGWIHVVSYHERSLERHLEEFLLSTGGRSIRPAPRIKFTLRVTSLIEDYLRYKTLNTKVSKADWVRDLIERVMSDDPGWQTHLKNRHRDED
jgi:hypothetical protein